MNKKHWFPNHLILGSRQVWLCDTLMPIVNYNRCKTPNLDAGGLADQGWSLFGVRNNRIGFFNSLRRDTIKPIDVGWEMQRILTPFTS